jgi:integrase
MSHIINTAFGYCFRLRVPPDLIDRIGKTELKYSLRTASRRKAKKQAGAISKQIKALFRELRQGTIMTKTEINEIVKEYVEWVRDGIEKDYSTSRRVLDPDTYQTHLDALEFYQTDLKEELAYHDRKSVYNIVDGFLKERGIPIDRDSDTYQMLAHEILKAKIHLLEYEIEQAKTGGLNDGINFAAQAVKAKNEILASSTQGKPQVPSSVLSPESTSASFSKVAQAYWDEMKPSWKIRTVPENRTFHNKLLEFIGPDRMIHSVEIETGRRYKEMLSKITTNRKKKMSTARVDMYLGYASSVFRWAIRNKYFFGENPFTGLQYGKKHRKKAQKQRKIFKEHDLKLMFVDSKEYGQDKWGKASHSHFFWIPLLGLFTGARLEELGQLYVEDVKKIDGVWCININESRPDQSVKTGEERIVPLHDFLVETLSFIEYVKSLPPTGRVFPQLKPVNDRYTHGFSMWFGKFKTRCGIKDNKKVFHSFRHTVQTQLALNDVPDFLISQLVGHTNEGQTTGRYIKDFDPKPLKEKVINKLDYGLDLTHLANSKHVVK